MFWLFYFIFINWRIRSTIFAKKFKVTSHDIETCFREIVRCAQIKFEGFPAWETSYSWWSGTEESKIAKNVICIVAMSVYFINNGIICAKRIKHALVSSTNIGKGMFPKSKIIKVKKQLSCVRTFWQLIALI